MRMDTFTVLFIFNLCLGYVNSAPWTALQENSICIFNTMLNGHEITFMRHNFIKLFDPRKDIVIEKSNNESIHIQLCSTLHNECNGYKTYSICLRKDNQDRGIGKEPPQIINDWGKIIFNFTGDHCKGNQSYRVIISMKCDYLALNNTVPELLPQGMDDCTFNMVWRTVLACPEAHQLNCTLQANNYTYDLSPLTRYSENYIIQTGNETYPKIILNVCHSVIFGPDALCQKTPGACVQLSEKRYEILGHIQKPPSIVGGNLVLTYENGQICTENVNVTRTSVNITFVCDYHAQNTLPVYIGGRDVCIYQLVWKTKAACDAESLRINRAVLPSNCTVINPITKFVYNMTALAGKDVTALSLDSLQYKFRVCGEQEDKSCRTGSGNCLVKNGTSFGRANANLIWQRGGPYLNYTNGDSCENGQARFTVIAFLCGRNVSMPIIVDSRPCHVIINWMTEWACDTSQQVKCLTDNKEVNLTPLIRFHDNYVVKTNTTEFHINICRPLIPKLGLLCPSGTGACGVVPISKDKYAQGINLGYAEEKPFIINEHQVGLRYTGGSVCKENSQKAVSTNLTFRCDYTNHGNPEYKGYSECTYLLEWKTNIVCRDGLMGNWIPPCTIKDEQSHEYNISALHEGQVRTVANKKGQKYSIEICGRQTCGGSAICLNNKGYGSTSQITLDHNRNSISIKYFNSTVCSDNSYMSEIKLVCNRSSGIGIPELLWETECSVGFEWATEVICEDSRQVEIVVTEQSSVKTTVPGEHASNSNRAGLTIGLVLLSIVILVGLIYCIRRERRERFCPPWSSFGIRRSDSRVQYCRVNTVEEARLLLDTSDPTECFSDSDDALLDA